MRGHPPFPLTQRHGWCRLHFLVQLPPGDHQISVAISAQFYTIYKVYVRAKDIPPKYGLAPRAAPLGT